jgi:hypothetical protein
MPLTHFQIKVLRLLAGNRGPESFIAGGSVINARLDSLRYSEDVDIFHDAQEMVVAAAEADAAVLTEAGFAVDWLFTRPGFQRAAVSRDGQTVRLEWVQDSAFRFFPVQQDVEFGWRLHLADLATNKILALAGRWEARDFVDTLYLDGIFAPIGLLAWAAAGKDPGLTPLLIIEMANRFNRMQADDFKKVLGAVQLDFVAMKTRWRDCVEAARELVTALPAEEVGALYLNAEGNPVDPRYSPGARVHYASLGGALPSIAGGPAALPGEMERQADEQVRERYGRSG